MTIDQVVEKAPDIGVYGWVFVITIILGVIFCIVMLSAFDDGEERLGYITLTLFTIVAGLGTYYSDVYANREQELKAWKSDVVIPYIDALPEVKREVISANVIGHYEGEQMIMNITYLENGVKKSFKGIADVMFQKDLKDDLIIFKSLDKSLPFEHEKGLYRTVYYTDEYPTFSSFSDSPIYNSNIINSEEDNIGAGHALLVVHGIGLLIALVTWINKSSSIISEFRRTRRLNRAMNQPSTENREQFQSFNGYNEDRYEDELYHELPTRRMIR